MVLLVGTIVGGIAQVGEAAAIGLTSIWPNTPAVFTSGSGRLLMAIATVFIIAPLCLVRRLRQVYIYIYIHSFLPACTSSSFIILVACCTHRIFDEREKSMEKKILQTLVCNHFAPVLPCPIFSIARETGRVSPQDFFRHS